MSKRRTTLHRTGLYDKLWGERLGYLGEEPTREQLEQKKEYCIRPVRDDNPEAIIQDLFGPSLGRDNR